MMRLMAAKLDGLPPTVNHLYRTARNSRRYKTHEGKEWQRQAAAVFADSYVLPEPYAGDVELNVYFLTADRRRWDIDNRVKALMDALMMGGVIRDDTQVKALHVERETVQEKTETVVFVRECVA